MSTDIQIITPPVANESDALDAGLVALTEAISKRDADLVAHGFLGGDFGYGAQFENEVFMMHPFCWCEQVDCLWCTIWLSNETDCSEEEAHAHRDKQIAQLAPIYGEGVHQAPNFWHKRTGLMVHWYKWIGRGMEITNPNAADFSEVLRECMESVGA